MEFPSLDALWMVAKTIIISLRPDADVGERSDLWLESYLVAKQWYRSHQTAQRVLDALFPTSSFGVYLTRLMAFHGLDNGSGGYGRIVVRGSTGSACLRVYADGGTVAASALQDTDWTYQDRTYRITDANSAITDGNYEDMDLEAVDTGAATNLETGTTLTAVSPPANCASTADLVADLDGGVDREKDQEGRARLVRHKQRPPASNNTPNLRELLEAASQGNLRVYCYPKRESSPYGHGSVDFAVLQVGETGSGRVITSAQETLVTDKIESDCPVQIWRNSRLLTVTPQATALEMVITKSPTAAAGKACDWDAYGASGALKATVSESTPGGLDLVANKNVCAPTVSGGLEVGHRVIIANGEAIVSEVNVGGGADEFKVSSWPTEWGASDNAIAGEYITSGGGMISAVLQAQKDYVDSLGPERGSYSDPVDTWDDSIRPSWVQKAGIDADDDGDVIDVEVLDIGGGGAATKAPTASVTSTIYLLTYGSIVVWEDKT